MIGNDWKKKGLEYLLEALGRLHHPALRLLVAGHDSLEPYRSSIDRLGLAGQLIFLPIRPDVEVYYAAADVYVCPSLEDAFAFPPFEAMACGLPVIVSCQAGVSELISDGVDGLLLRDPRNAESLAGLISKLFGDPALRSRLGENAANTASQYTWERNAEQFRALFEEVLHGKAGLCYREADA
jgi:UDP-glucose:(heptosyl)LPS alpha-1,3-glucosyltransferase